jgi:uncharacterized protein YceH (UPF0502 family)
MNIQLTPIEARIIGSLIEKAITTPDQYPLSLNALTNACNQKSNRDPVLELDERTVQENLDALARKHLVMEKSGFGSRVPKYQHRFCNTGFGSLEFTAQETAVLCELLLRGAQTPGELRARAGRLAEVHDVGEIESALHALASRQDGPVVVRLAREPGRRESRYSHLFGGAVQGAADEPVEAGAPGDRAGSQGAAGALRRGPQDASLEDRIATLERVVEQLQAQIAELKHGGGSGAD